MKIPTIAITPGEPAGIGPDIVLAMVQTDFVASLLVYADADLLSERAKKLGLAVDIKRVNGNELSLCHQPGILNVFHQPLPNRCQCGQLDPSHASYVLSCLRHANEDVMAGKVDALVTGPVHKGNLNEAGYAFSGHTEFLAELSGVRKTVMMLANERFRVALLTTHIPLMAVPQQLTSELLMEVIQIVHQDLVNKFGVVEPKIAVCGLNPHAGESGHLGREEIDVMVPTLEKLRAQGLNLIGPLPADTAFLPKYTEACDVILALYHDQGLPVVKAGGVERVVNITLGLPYIRTSVGHGTALDLAGTGRADSSSMLLALTTAIKLAKYSS